MLKYYQIITTDWGYVAAIWSSLGLWKLSFPCEYIEALDTDVVQSSDMTFSEALERELKGYFTGSQVTFTIPIDWTGYTSFQASVLQYTASIPYSQVKSYGDVARAIGSPKASRAVGGALHVNRTPVVVPCHRVIGANGKLVGFGGGLVLKERLLLFEQHYAD